MISKAKEGFNVTAHLTHVMKDDLKSPRDLSIFTSYFYNEGNYTEYKQGVSVYPKNDESLALFNTVDDAIKFILGMGFSDTIKFTKPFKDDDLCSFIEIWACEYIPSKKARGQSSERLSASSVTLRNIVWKNHE